MFSILKVVKHCIWTVQRESTWISLSLSDHLLFRRVQLSPHPLGVLTGTALHGLVQQFCVNQLKPWQVKTKLVPADVLPELLLLDSEGGGSHLCEGERPLVRVLLVERSAPQPAPLRQDARLLGWQPEVWVRWGASERGWVHLSSIRHRSAENCNAPKLLYPLSWWQQKWLEKRSELFYLQVVILFLHLSVLLLAFLGGWFLNNFSSWCVQSNHMGEQRQHF